MSGPRIVTTNDFVGSFFPQPTSYGQLPGAAALQATVDAARAEAGGACWIDTGDHAQGSALGALSDGVWPFLALRELSIDIAVVGNHELDWGVAHLRRWSAELPFPLLAANLPLGLPAARLLEAGGRVVGAIGLSLPAMAELHSGLTADPDPAAAAVRLARELRSQGADHVVVALHDGVDPGAAVERMTAFCGAVRGHVDLVLGGHTLRCFAGSLAGVPFLQPWGFGSQVGVADLFEDGARVRLVDVAPNRRWEGAGAAAQTTLEAEVVGRLDRPLVQSPGRDTSLARAVADGVLRRDGTLDRVYVGPGDLWTQPARDGVDAHLSGGDVTLAQVLRLTPLTGGRSAWGGQLVAAELPAGDGDAVLAALDGGGVVAGPRGQGGGTLALSAFHATVADRALGRPLGWQTITTTLRDGLMAAVAR